MAEIKNTFLKSKMNKDLDDRLLPNGEYRDAQNISVGKSEDADVGALENIIGNINATPVLPYSSDCEIIGYYSDKTNDRIVTFVTNYTDPAPNNPTYAPPTAECHICIFNSNNSTYENIVSGSFLNFSTTDRVLGVNLIENLLFFTDNRNQPRKININTAILSPSYYNSEDNISVAKYNPYKCISLVRKIDQTTTADTINSNVLFIDDLSNKVISGMVVVAKKPTGGYSISGDDYITVESVTSNSVTLKQQAVGSVSLNIDTGSTITFLQSTMSNKEDPTEYPNWPGDPDLLEDRYVRFSYRFKFDDGEYSLTAPFTQIAYVPKQKGYFQNEDEDAAYRSTVLDFMENEINDIELLVPLPSKGSLLQQEYKVQSVDILYKESDGLSIKVLETIPISDISTTEDGNPREENIYTYIYQSRKPYKTLPQFETTRVYDKVPVRAKAQEASGNRIIYGNYRDINTPPDFIDYYVGAFEKNTNLGDSFVEYPNHTLKQNRNYQIGFILADKFGRQSPVILSPVTVAGLDTGSNFKGGSTIYHPYNSENSQGNIRDWFGDAIQVVINTEINSIFNRPLGRPGMYAERYKDSNFLGEGFSISSSSFLNNDQTQYVFTLDTLNPDNASVPIEGTSLSGEYRDYVKVTSVIDNGGGTYTVEADGSISSSYLPKVLIENDIKFAYNINPIGWYSYKIVVKQTEQEYYNCYLPGILNGYPDPIATPSPYPTSEVGKTAHVVLLNDNINKIPRDLSEVGPDQKQYRSSVRLFGRVENNILSNEQYFPGRATDTVSTIATSSDLNMDFNDINSVENFYQLDTNPNIARISTLSAPIGVTENSMVPFLAIYETEPVVSLLDIFWETTSTGSISELNEDVSTGSPAPVGFTEINFNFRENQDSQGTGDGTGDVDSPWVTDSFFPITAEGTPITGTTITSFTVTDSNDPAQSVTYFSIEQETDITSPFYGSYRIKFNSQDIAYTSNYATNSVFFFSMTFNYVFGEEVYTPTLGFQGSLTNIDPYLSISQFSHLDPAPQILPQIISYPGSPLSLGNIATAVVNGAHEFNPAKQDVGVFFTSVPDSPDPITIPNSVTINHSTSEMVKGYDWGQGIYEIKLKVKDALSSFNSGQQSISSQGNTTPGTNESIEYSQEVRVIQQPVSSGLITNCLSTYDPINPDPRVINKNVKLSSTQQFGNIYNVYAAWYVADNTLASNDYPSLYPTINTNPNDPGNYVAEPIRLGTEGFSNTSATIQFDLMAEILRSNTTNSWAAYSWKIFYRSSSSQSWTDQGIYDINGTNISYMLEEDGRQGQRSTNSGQFSEITTKWLLNNSTVNNKEALNIPIAFDVNGEYFIQVIIYDKLDAQQENNAFDYACAWVNSNDAYNPTCVPNYGDNEAANKSSWEYSVLPERSSRTLACEASEGANTYWARTPYPHIVKQFWNNSSFTQEPSPSIADGFHSYFYQAAPVTTLYDTGLNMKMSANFTNTTDTVIRKGWIDGVRVICQQDENVQRVGYQYDPVTNIPDLTTTQSVNDKGLLHSISRDGTFPIGLIDPPPGGITFNVSEGDALYTTINVTNPQYNYHISTTGTFEYNLVYYRWLNFT